MFYLPGAENNDDGARLVSTNDLAPDGEGIIDGLGLIDLDDEGEYQIQVFLDPEDASGQVLSRRRRRRTPDRPDRRQCSPARADKAENGPRPPPRSGRS